MAIGVGLVLFAGLWLVGHTPDPHPGRTIVRIGSAVCVVRQADSRAVNCK